MTELRRSGGMSQIVPAASRGPEIMKYGVSTSVRKNPNSALTPSNPSCTMAPAAMSFSAVAESACMTSSAV